jgi:hypothetical protein
MGERIGEFLMRTEGMTAGQVDAVLKAQKDGDKRTFGDIAVALGFARQEAVQKFMQSQQ